MLERYPRRPELLAQLQRLTLIEDEPRQPLTRSQGVLLGLAAAIKEDARGLKFSRLSAASPFVLSVVSTTLSGIGLYQAEEAGDEHLDDLIQSLKGLSPDGSAHNCPPRPRLVPDAAHQAVCQRVGEFEGTGIWPVEDAQTIRATLEELTDDPVRETVFKLLLDLHYGTEHLALHDLLICPEPVVTLYVGQLLSALAGFYAGDQEAIANWLVEAGTVTSLAMFRDPVSTGG